MNFFCCYIVIKNKDKDGRSKTILSLIYPGSATISIVPALTLQEVNRLASTAQQCTGRPSCHSSEGSAGGLFSPSFLKWVTA